jgi:hypothetical protein
MEGKGVRERSEKVGSGEDKASRMDYSNFG